MEKKDSILKPFVAENLFWIREPKQYTVTDSLITIVSEPHTDLWQRTYYGFSNDNAPVLQMKTSDKFFSFPSRHRSIVLPYLTNAVLLSILIVIIG